jgi:hypothetical protein
MNNDTFYKDLINQNLQDPVWRENCSTYNTMMAVVQDGKLHELEGLALSYPPFPHGADPFLERNWITNAINSHA